MNELKIMPWTSNVYEIEGDKGSLAFFQGKSSSKRHIYAGNLKKPVDLCFILWILCILLWIMRFFLNCAIGRDLRLIVRNCTIEIAPVLVINLAANLRVFLVGLGNSSEFYGGGIGTKMQLNRVSCHRTINAMPLNHTSSYRITYFMPLDQTSFYWIVHHFIGSYISCHWIGFHVIG